MNQISLGLKPALILMCCLTVFAGCVSMGERDQKKITAQVANSALEEKIAAEPPAPDANAIALRAAETFSNAEGLTPQQKQKLMEIYHRTYEDAIAIQTEIGKSKSLLFKLISSVAYDSDDIDRIRKKVVDLDQKRLDLMFQALADVQGVVGYGKDKEQFYKHFYDYEIPRGAPTRFMY